MGESFPGIEMDGEPATESAAPTPDIVMDSSAPAEPAPVPQGPEFGPTAADKPLTPEDLWRQAAVDPRWAAQHADENAQLSQALQSTVNLDRKASVLRLASDLKIPSDVVEHRFEDFKATWEASKFDAEAWGKANPALRKLALEHPDLGEVIVRDVQLDPLNKLFNWAHGFINDEAVKVRTAQMSPQDQLHDILDNKAADQQAATEQAAREAPKPTLFISNPSSQYVSEEKRHLIPILRFKENWDQMEVSNLRYELMQARHPLPGFEAGDTFELEKRILDAERAALPRDYNEQGALEESLSTAAQAFASQGQVFKQAGVFAGVGGAVGFLVGLAATKTPAGALRGGMQGASLLGKAGVFVGSLKLEAGAAYGDFLRTKTDSGENLTEDEAAGAAITYGMLAATVELASTAQLLKAMGPLGAALRQGTGKAALSELLKDAGMRDIVKKVGKEWFKEGLAEGGEEIVQEALQQVTGYLARSAHDKELQKGPVFDPQALLASGYAGALGGLAMGGAASSVHAATELFARGRDLKAGEQAAVLAGIKDSPTVKAAPQAVADMIEKESAATGAPVTHLYVDAQAFSRMFQEAGDGEQGAVHVAPHQDAAAAAETILGPGGREALQEAIATGGKLAIPVAAYLEKMGGTELAKHLTEDTTTQPWSLTPRQLTEQGPEIEKQAQAIAEAEAKVGADQTDTGRKLDALEAQLVATGKHTPGEATKLVTGFRRFLGTAASRFGMSEDALFSSFRVSTGLGDAYGHKASQLLTQRAKSIDAKTRARDLYIDPVTQLRNFAGWEATKRTPGSTVAVITIPDIKAVNDDVAGGHDTSNDVLRTASIPIAVAHPGAARKGTNFVFEGGEAELAATLDQVRAALPEGLTAVGAIGANSKQALDNLDAHTKSLRESGALPERGKTALDLKTLPQVEQSLAKHTHVATELPQDLIDAAGALTPEQMFKAYMDPSMPSVLNAAGWEHVPRKAWVASIDIKGLKAINDGVFGHAGGDSVLEAFALAAQRMGGNGLDFAHLSGDEFAAQSDSMSELQQFLDDVRDELQGVTPTLTLSDTGEVVELDVAVEFRSGIGEKTYGAADRALNVAKAKERGAAAKNVADPVGAVPEGSSRSDGGDHRVELPGEGDLAQRRARARGRGTRGQGFVDRSGIVETRGAQRGRGAVSDSADLGGDASFNVAALELSPEQVAEQRKKIARKKDPARRARLTAWLNFTLDDGDRPAEDAQPSNADIKALEAAGFVSPDGPLFDEKGKRLDQPLAGPRRKGKATTSTADRLAFKNQIEGHDSGGSGKLFQFPTPEESKKAMEDLAVFLDYAHEKGAKPVESDESVGGKRGGQSRFAAARSDDARYANQQTADALRSIEETRFGDHFGQSGDETDLGEVDREADRAASALDGDTISPPIPKSKNLPGQASLERFLQQVYSQKDRMFQPTAEQQKTLDVAAKVEAALKDAGLDPTRMFAPGENDGDQPRGYSQVAADGISKIYEILLNPSSNVSTFLHESAHVFLELFADLAQRTDAPAQVQDDFAQMLGWMGVKDPQSIKRNVDGWSFEREHHEKWARTFEAYVREGKAPSDQLRGAFRRFTLWLRDLYRTVVPGSDLNPEIQGVFDRLLATDDEINASRRRMGFDRSTEIFKNAGEAGMTEEQFRQLLDDRESAASHAERAVLLRASKDELRETEAWWKDGEAKAREEAEKAYDKRPDVKAARYLRRGEVLLDDGNVLKVPQGKLDKAAVEKLIGAEAAKKLLGRRLEENGEDPETVAEKFGFTTPAEMLKALETVPDRKVWTKATALQSMTEQYPGVMEDRILLRNVIAQGLHGDLTATALLKEWSALRAKAKQGTVAPVEAIKEAARLMVDKRELGRLDPGLALRQERAAAEAAAKAAAKKDWTAAAVFKQRQLLNLYLHRELTDAKEEREKFLELVSTLSKDKARERIGKASPVYLEGIDMLLEALDLKPRTALPQNRPSITQIVDQMNGDGASVMFDEDALSKLLAKSSASWTNPTTWKQISVAEMRQVDIALKNIRGAASSRNSVIVDEKRAEFQFVIDQLLEEAGKNLPPLPPLPSGPSAASPMQKLGGWANAFDGSMLRPELMIDWLAGGDLKSMWHRALVQPLQSAKHREADLLKQIIKPIVEAFEKVPAAVRKRFTEHIDGAKLFPGHAVASGQEIDAPNRRFQLLLMALNAGNQSNLDRLLIGRGITPDQLTAAINTLSKEELDWVQSIWDAAEALWPLSEELELRDSGVAPPKLELKPLVTVHGTYRGGYFPAVYDSNVEQAGTKQMLREIGDLLDQHFNRAFTPHSHLKSRVEGFTGAISLEPGTISSHLAKVAHDIAYREAVKSVGGLIMDERIQAALKTRLGPERAVQFLQWVKDVGQMRSSDSSVHAGVVLKAAKALRANTVIAALGYSAPNALEDLTSNLLGAVPASELEAKHLAAAIATMTTSPINTMNDALSKSGELRFRRDQIQRDLQQQVKSLTQSQAFGMKQFRWMKNHAFVFAEEIDKMTATPIWLGAYRQAIAKGESEKDAITFGDAVLRKLMPSHSAVDQAALLRDKGFVGTSMVFFGFFNTFYNRQRDLVHQAEGVTGTAKAAGRLLAYAMAVSVFGAFMRGQGPEKDESWEFWFMRKLLGGQLSMIPLAGDAFNTWERQALGKQAQPRPQLLSGWLLSLGEAILDLKNDDKEGLAKVEALIRFAGQTAGFPTSQLLKTGKFLLDVADGTVSPEGPEDFVSGMLYGDRGENQPITPLHWPN